MKNSITSLFVYGTLRKGFHHPAYEYISKHFSFVSDARVRGMLYDMGEYPAAKPTSEDLFITGELYELKASSNFEWAIEQLDDYEGLNPPEGVTELYRRELAEVFYNNQVTKAWMYWYNGNITEQPFIASGNIFEYINYKSTL